ncbi:MAG: tetratricopeptide repeat protein [Deltaproteobacteria bacterium]|nr:tetratricopeptide repeat protein [Deltaproteobacteria bacterium]
MECNIKRQNIVFALPAAIITFLMYLGSLRNGFVNWDDPGYILENPNLASFNFKWIFTELFYSNWHPLTTLSYVIDFNVWGLNPFGYHLENVILHAINTFFVAVLTMRLVELKSAQKGLIIFAGLFSGLLFGLHPLHVESVAWISERKDVLCGFFFFLTILSYIKYCSTNSVVSFLSSLIFFSLALMSKPMAITLPVVLMLIDFYPLERFSFKNIGKIVVEKIPFFALSLISAILTVLAQQKSTALVSLKSYSILERIGLAVRGFGFYLYKTVLPFNLSPFYPRPSEAELFNSVFLISLLVIIALTVLCLIFLKKKIFLASWLYFLITLIPVIGIIQVGNQAAADRYTYIPSASLFILAGVALGLLYSKGEKKSFRIIIAVLSFLFFIPLSYLTVKQIAVWKDSVTLWSHAIKVYPDKIEIAYYNRGLAYDREGRFDSALSDYTKAIAAYPEYVDAYVNRGIVYGELNELGKAIEDFNKAAEINPAYANTFLNRGTAYISLQRFDLAVADFQKVLELQPDNAIANYNLGLAYSRLGDNPRASVYFQRASQLGLR